MQRVDRAAAALHVQFRARRCHAARIGAVPDTVTGVAELSVPAATVAVVSSPDNAGKVRYTYRLRLSAGAQGLLLAEWDRCRWVWNRCVEASNAAHQESMATGVKAECGPALLDKRLTGWRAEHEWLAAGSSVAQQQTIRDFGRARAKALKDRKDKKLPRAAAARDAQVQVQASGGPESELHAARVRPRRPPGEAGRWDRGAAGVVA